MARRAARKVRVEVAVGFKASYRAYRRANPEIQAKLTVFNRNKRRIPPVPLPPEMRDHFLTGPLAGFRECHLANDILLIYTHRGDVVRLLRVCQHSDLHRRSFAKTIKRLLN